MSFILKEPTTFLNIKLTDTGRKMMALGNFKMSKALLLDREIDYTIDNGNDYNMFDNRVIDPPDFYPDPEPFNLDGSAAFALSAPQVTSIKQIITATTSNRGMFTGSVGAWTLDSTQLLGQNHIDYVSNTPNSNTLVLDNGVGSYFPKVGDLIFIPWSNNASEDYMASSLAVPIDQPIPCSWYRVVSINSATQVTLDRSIPVFNDGVGSECFFYPFNGIEAYYGTGATQSTQPWNLNIVRTKDIIGVIFPTGTSGSTDYRSYGSLEYAGTKRYFGFSSETPAVGFIHYTNENTGNTYAEQFLEKSVELHLPMIMWYHNGEENNNGITFGTSFYDEYGQTAYDPYAQTSYRDLKDGKSYSSITVGRVYHKLKMIVITDQELLIAMSYKSNRNYTFPDFSLSYSNEPKSPMMVNNCTGLCRSGYTYYVTYIPEQDTIASLTTDAKRDLFPCGYIKKIEGSTDEFGNPFYLQMNFHIPDSFPFMRNENSLWDGFGWTAEKIHVLINEQPSYYNYGIADVPNNGWKYVSSLNYGNGYYISSDYGDNTIDARKLNNHTMIMSAEDLISGTTFFLSTGLTMSMDILNWGDESFLHGVINAKIMATSYKSSMMITASDNNMNSSVNKTYNASDHEEVYITEVLILDDLNQVVAVGKPTYPVRKRNGKYIAFQLEYDF